MKILLVQSQDYLNIRKKRSFHSDLQSTCYTLNLTVMKILIRTVQIICQIPVAMCQSQLCNEMEKSGTIFGCHHF